MARKTIGRKASNTAAYTCVSRVCAAREKDERFRGPDYLAEIFLPFYAKCLLSISFLRTFLMKKVAPPGIYEYVLARTKLFDEIFIYALEDNFSQIVLLGAGMDTRALRLADKNRGTMIYELDIHATQNPKINILRRKKIALPEELIFIPIDFNKQDLSDVLFEAGYRSNERSLFLWEGVTMYLDPEAIGSTLDFIQHTAGNGNIVVFDYILASVLRRENRFYGEKEVYRTVSRAGEGWTFGIEDGEVERFLSERGFTVVDHYTSTELEKRYLTADDGTLFGRINGTHCIVIASAS